MKYIIHGYYLMCGSGEQKMSLGYYKTKSNALIQLDQYKWFSSHNNLHIEEDREILD